MDEVAAARFERANQTIDHNKPPKVEEVLNAAIKHASEEGFTNVTVVLHKPGNEDVILLTNIPSRALMLGLFALAAQGGR